MRQPDYLRQGRQQRVEWWLAGKIKDELMIILVERKHRLLEPVPGADLL